MLSKKLIKSFDRETVEVQKMFETGGEKKCNLFYK